MRMATSLKVMEIRPKGSRKELILLDQNLNTTLINSTSREVFIMVRLINSSIPKDANCPLKWGDNLATHATHPSEALGHDLVGFTIGLNFFLRNNSVFDLNRKGKLGGEEDTSPRECANSGPSKGEREIVLQNKKLY